MSISVALGMVVLVLGQSLKCELQIFLVLTQFERLETVLAPISLI
jgi:hypothetical protein